MSSGTYVVLGTAALLLAVAVTLGPANFDGMLRDTDRGAVRFRKVRRVTVPVSERDRLDFYSTLAESHSPVILEGGLIVSWPAFNKWTPKYISSRLKWVDVHVQRDSYEFITWHDGKELEPHVTTGTWNDFNKLQNMSADRIYDEGLPAKYFSSEVRNLTDRMPDIVRDLSPLRPLVVNDSGVQVNVWLGARHIETYTHYDASWNFFGQLHGRKRFTLFPPSIPMSPWPCLHPHIGHSQLPWREANVSKLSDLYPDFVKMKPEAMVADLRRGDMLYLPPYWWHHVETLEGPAVAVNVWSDAPSYLYLDKAYRVALPFEEEWSRSRMVFVVRLFLGKVIDKIKSDKGIPYNVNSDLIQQRWDKLVQSKSLEAMDDTILSTTCRCARSLDKPASCEDNAISLNLESILERRADEVLEQLLKIEPSSVRQLSLGNYIEHVVSATIGPLSTYWFLKHCF